MSMVDMLFPQGTDGVGKALQTASPMLLAMSAGLQQGQSPFTYAPQGIAVMQQNEALRRARQNEAAETAAAERARSQSLSNLSTLLGGQPARPTMSRNQALATHGGPTVAAANASGGRDKFLSTIAPHAVRVGRQIGVDPRIIVAQAALESGWGSQAPGNNFFGIKSHGEPNGQVFTTSEYVDGERISTKDSFRQYDSPEESVRGYGDFLLSNPRYQPMLQAQGFEAQLRALGQSGYATDPNYAAKVGRIANGLDLSPFMGQQPANGGMNAEALAAVMMDPNVPADVKTSLYQRAFPQADQANLSTVTGPQGGVYAFNPATGQLQPLLPGAGPRPMSGPGKVQADIEAGFLPEGTPVRGTQTPQIGSIPPGYQVVQDGQAFRMEVIPGGPADIAQRNAAAEEQDAAISLELASADYDRKFGIVDNALGQAIEMLEERGGLVAGAGSIAALLPGTPAKDFGALIDTVKANLGFEELQAMRDSSPTGGALGQVTEREIAFLQAIQGNLDTAQSPAQLLQVMKNIRARRAEFAAERRRITQSSGSLDFGSMSTEELERYIQDNGQ